MMDWKYHASQRATWCRVELGRALAKMGEKEAALKELEQAMGMEVEDINAHLQKVLLGLLSCPAITLPRSGSVRLR